VAVTAQLLVMFVRTLVTPGNLKLVDSLLVLARTWLYIDHWYSVSLP